MYNDGNKMGYSWGESYWPLKVLGGEFSRSLFDRHQRRRHSTSLIWRPHRSFFLGLPISHISKEVFPVRTQFRDSPLPYSLLFTYHFRCVVVLCKAQKSDYLFQKGRSARIFRVTQKQTTKYVICTRDIGGSALARPKCTQSQLCEHLHRRDTRW